MLKVLHRVYQSEGVLRYFPVTVPPPMEKVQRFIRRQGEHWEKHRYGNWGLLPHGGHEVIGWAGLQYLPELDETEVGFLLDRPWWGKGYATEAAQASIKFGFDHFGMYHRFPWSILRTWLHRGSSKSVGSFTGRPCRCGEFS